MMKNQVSNEATTLKDVLTEEISKDDIPAEEKHSKKFRKRLLVAGLMVDLVVLVVVLICFL
eukprot:CAMPEP_0116139976 /NCGR_PEP_ID=MMETSP0329-20121206/13595_1 /TAXON_ID=697910 /ORGANISM="Pseudo-nitzschia arenysensis, Strain B593" /LENGTH=60 /DNA_ID=CAMNT_0003635047 /DNA_START=150 /DNA_END=332 /DNA_ORIENTATION=+